MNIKDHLDTVKEFIDEGLDKFLPPENENPKSIHKAMRYSVFSGGKRIRPILTIEAAKACGASAKKALAAACVIELIHTFSLIHDDLPALDDDDYRRGKPTCHKVFGEATAILAGDALLTLAFNIISKNMDPRSGIESIRELSEALGTKGMVGGQIMDLEFQAGRKSKTTLILANRLKTAKLFEASTRLGALASGARADKVKAMAAFGGHMGLAFQIVDDILDREAYVKIFGLDKARTDAAELTKKAKEALLIFGKKAITLERIADYVLSRAK